MPIPDSNIPPERPIQELFLSHLIPGTAGVPAILLAPMAGYTNAVTRRIAYRHGARLTYTEMTNASGLVHASNKTWQLLETVTDEGPCVAHLYGTIPEDFAEASRRIAATRRFCAIDINAGCPVPRIAHTGAGASLLRQPALAGRIVAAIRKACDLPVTVKTRLGPHPGAVAIFDLLQAVQDAGAAALALHGRFTSQGHTGPVDLACVAAVHEKAQIPVIGNGGIVDDASARQYHEATGVETLMIGQAAIGNPWIFQELNAGFSHPDLLTPFQRPTLDELRAALFTHMKEEIEWLKKIERKYPQYHETLDPETATVIEFRSHFSRYLKGLRGVTRLRGRMSQTHTLADLQNLVDECLSLEADFRARKPEP